MKERSLNERFIELEDRMISVEALTKYGTANDMKFYIFDYNPQDEYIIRHEVKKLKGRNPDIVEFDLYEMMLEIIEQQGYMQDVIEAEKDYGALSSWKEMKVDSHLVETLQKRLMQGAQLISLA